MGNKNHHRYIAPEPAHNNNLHSKSNSWFLLTEEEDSMFEPILNKKVQSGSSPSRYFVAQAQSYLVAVQVQCAIYHQDEPR